MPSEIEQLLRDHARHLDAEMTPITVHEVTERPGSPTQTAPIDTQRGRPRKAGLGVAAALIVIIGAGLLIARLGDDRPRIVTPTETAAPETPAATAPVITEAIAEPTPMSAPPSSTDTTVVATTLPEPAITTEQVQLAQREALRTLTGFSATASFAVTDESADLGQPEAVTYTLLADGSVYVATGPDTFGSFDPVTGIVLGVFRDETGNLTAQEITGQTDNGLPLTILGGYDPTRLIETGKDAMQTIREVDVEGRPAWEVTTVEEFTTDEFSSAPFDTDTGTDFVQTTIQVIDQESGLIVMNAESSTDPNAGGDRVTTLSDIAVVDTMPPEFPGTLPDTVDVDRSGSPAPITGATVEEVVELFGVAVPIPEGLIAGTAVAGDPVEIVLEDRPQFEEADDPEGEPRTTFREARFTIREGFVATTVAVSSIALRDDAVVPEGLALSEGYLCFDSDGDGACNSGGDPQGFTDGDGVVPIGSGLLVGLSAELSSLSGTIGSGSTYYGPFSVAVYQSDRATIDAILGSFELVFPSG